MLHRPKEAKAQQGSMNLREEGERDG